MRTRVLALSILCIFLGIPFGLYWYFFLHRTSSMQFHIAQESPMTIMFEGTLEYDYLPLADSILRFEQTCLIYCETGPIAPVLYRVTISGSGHETIRETYRLSV